MEPDFVPASAESWFPLLAMVEYREGIPPTEGAAVLPARLGEGLSDFTPSPRLRHALLTLREALYQEMGEQSAGKRHWLLLEGAGTPLGESLAVSKVLDELRQRFQNTLGAEDSLPDLEQFLREKMRQMGFEELSTGPLLPELQREALRGLGVGLGSQMAQLLGKMAGWHGEARTPPALKTPKENKAVATAARILRLEVGPRIAVNKAAALELRGELTRARRNLSLALGWEISGLHLTVSRDLPEASWRLFLRNEQVGEGNSLSSLLSGFEPLLQGNAAELFTFADFDIMARDRSCRAVVKELRTQGLEKATLWTLFRRRLSQGHDLRDPLTLFEKVLEGSVVSLDPEHLMSCID